MIGTYNVDSNITQGLKACDIRSNTPDNITSVLVDWIPTRKEGGPEKAASLLRH